MRLVVDTNILFSFFRKESKTRELILNFELLDLSTPAFCISELLKYRETICEKSDISDTELSEVLEDISLFVGVAPLSEYEELVSKAKSISPDRDDIDIFALALSLNCAIWSNDKALKKQDVVKVYSTEEILGFLGLR